MDLLTVRNLYYKATTSRKDADKFETVMKSATGISPSTLAGYKGMSSMINANYSFNPYNKLSFFIKGKDLLEEAIKVDPKNVELRFLRFCVQTNAPFFLGYSGKIEEDKAMLLANFSGVKDTDLASRISEFMKTSKYCTAEDKVVFK